MAPLKILYLPLWYPSAGKNPFGGMSIRERAKAASLYNDVIVVYCYELSNKRQVFYDISDRSEDGLRTIRVSLGCSNIKVISFIVRLIALSRILRRLIKSGWKPDVIDAHNYDAAIPAIILRQFYKIPVAITEHSGLFQLRTLSFIERLLANFAMKRANTILPISKDLKKAITECYGIKTISQDIPNVINTNIFRFSAGEVKANGGKIILVTVGLIAEHKGMGILLEAINQLRSIRKDFHLDIIGDGPQKEHYEKLTSSLNMCDLVQFHGAKSLEEVATFMRACDFFVLPSYHESFGNIYIEAMACGKPVIATNAGAPPEFVKDFTGVLITPRSLEQLVNAIKHMLDNYHQYNSNNIAKYARETFGYEVIGKKLDLIYRNILTETRKRYNV